jgi:cation-transporting ATPase 13A2
LRYYTHHGYRVIAVAWKMIVKEPLVKVVHLDREQVESDLKFLGFIVFENKVKPGTVPVIETLNMACIRQIMCTGDNILTSISVSKECGLINPHQKVFVSRFASGQSHEENAVIVWEDVDEPKRKLDSITFMVFFCFILAS